MHAAYLSASLMRRSPSDCSSASLRLCPALFSCMYIARPCCMGSSFAYVSLYPSQRPCTSCRCHKKNHTTDQIIKCPQNFQTTATSQNICAWMQKHSNACQECQQLQRVHIHRSQCLEAIAEWAMYVQHTSGCKAQHGKQVNLMRFSSRKKPALRLQCCFEQSSVLKHTMKLRVSFFETHA